MKWLAKKEDPKDAEPKDPVTELCKKIRDKDGIEYREAVVSGTRVEFFRGKDFFRYFRDNKDALNAVAPGGKQKMIDTRIKELGEDLMLHKKLFFRAERLYTKPKPGKTKLVKWPKKLTMTAGPPRLEMVDDGSAFYAWIHERESNKLFTGILSGLLVVFTIACCLFPLAPNWVKLAVLYTCFTLLTLILSLAVVRLVVFGVIWMAVGRSIWLWPNLFSDDVGILQAFKPWIEEEKNEDGEPTNPSWVTRLTVLAGICTATWLLARHAPDGASVRDATAKAHKDILQYLNIYEDQGRLAGGENETNATNATNATGGVEEGGAAAGGEGAAGGAEGVGAADGGAGGGAAGEDLGGAGAGGGAGVGEGEAPPAHDDF